MVFLEIWEQIQDKKRKGKIKRVKGNYWMVGIRTSEDDVVRIICKEGVRVKLKMEEVPEGLKVEEKFGAIIVGEKDQWVYEREETSKEMGLKLKPVEMGIIFKEGYCELEGLKGYDQEIRRWEVEYGEYFGQRRGSRQKRRVQEPVGIKIKYQKWFQIYIIKVIM